MRRLCVFCGSSKGQDRAYASAAARVGALAARAGWGIVFGGGQVGLMGLLADAALASGTEVVGVIPEKLKALELGHGSVTRLEVVSTMHARKARMAELSDAFLALPGGYGTLDELFEALTWSQLGYHAKPVGLLNVSGFFEPLLAFLDRQVDEGFLAPAHRALVMEEEDPEPLLERLARACGPPAPFEEP